VRCKEYKLDELLGGITGKNLHQPIDTGAPVGKKVW
jgi:antitoxin component of MazEF toxin-antitoxin module